MKLDTQRIRLLRLKINAESVKYSIAESNVVKLSLSQIHIKANQVITIEEDGHNEKWRSQIPDIRESITGVLVKGLKEVNRAVISHMDGHDGQYNMIVDGADLAGVLATPGINWKKTYSNHTPKVSCKLHTRRLLIFSTLNWPSITHEELLFVELGLDTYKNRLANLPCQTVIAGRIVYIRIRLDGINRIGGHFWSYYASYRHYYAKLTYPLAFSSTFPISHSLLCHTFSLVYRVEFTVFLHD